MVAYDLEVLRGSKPADWAVARDRHVGMDRLAAAIEAMPAIAEAVNAFESEAAQLRALNVLLN